MKIKILPSASQELIDGSRFYEKQTEGLGTYFLDTLYSDIDSLTIYAGIHPIYFIKYHRLLSKRFPFAIVKLLFISFQRMFVLLCHSRMFLAGIRYFV